MVAIASILDRNDFSFYQQVILMLPTNFESIGLSVQEKKQK